MEPFDVLPIEAPANAGCTECDGPLERGQRWRCLACVAAAYRAVEKARGGVVRPSMIAEHLDR